MSKLIPIINAVSENGPVDAYRICSSTDSAIQQDNLNSS